MLLAFRDRLRASSHEPMFLRSSLAPPPASLLAGAERSSLPAQNGLDLGLDGLLILKHERDLATEDAARLTQKPEADTRAALRTSW